MRFRFSLRTFFLLVTLLACFVYIWFIRPSHIAARIAATIDAEDYESADRLLLRTRDQFLTEWADNRWAFRASCDLRPLTLGQLLTGRRQVDLHLGFFEFDHRASQQVQLAATPFGLASPSLSPVQYSERFIDRALENTTPLR